MNKRQLVSFCSLKNDHFLAVYSSAPIMVAGPPLSTDAYMANREWGFLMPISPSGNIGGLKRDSLSTDTILGYYYSQLTASVSQGVMRMLYFLVTIYIYDRTVIHIGINIYIDM